MINRNISTIYFTFKRAILLHTSYESLIRNFINYNHDIKIIYHYDKNHENSYHKFFDNFPQLKNNLVQRKKEKYLINGFKTLRPLNLLWLARWPKMFSEFNNFKFLLENVLEEIDNEFVMFVPDDQIFYKKTIIPEKALDLISENKHSMYYRFFTGNHFLGKYSLPPKLNVETFEDNGIKFFKWSNKDRNAINLWNYRFTIEGTIFHKEGLLNLLKPMIYHNPITLEAIGLWESRFRNLFVNGLSAEKRTAATFNINNVQQLVRTPNSFHSPEKLMEYYNLGYRLQYNEKDFDDTQLDIVPKGISLKHVSTGKIINI